MTKATSSTEKEDDKVGRDRVEKNHGDQECFHAKHDEGARHNPKKPLRPGQLPKKR